MDIKKIFYICLIFIVAASCITAVSSAFLESQGITPFSQDTNVTVEGFTFLIPAGYGEDMTVHEDNVEDDGIISSDRTYFNENADLVGVTVMYAKNGGDLNLEIFKEPNSIEKTIDGKKGYLDKSEEVEGLYFFTYVENNKAIMLSAPDEATFSQMIL
ncbi:MAG: hypothetical protein IJ104_07200 [Methanobrevibacter sp.]|nr:hypothetical protein [Methanobrevibacter sp.]